MNQIEKKIKENWPSAVEGDLDHQEFGLVHYWYGEKYNRIVLRFSFEGQDESESEKIFFINLKHGSWILSHISTFKISDSKLQLVKNQSFKERDELEKKYRSIFELFLEDRKKKKFF